VFLQADEIVSIIGCKAPSERDPGSSRGAGLCGKAQGAARNAIVAITVIATSAFAFVRLRAYLRRSADIWPNGARMRNSGKQLECA
jgi:hypothetical protein